MGSRLSADFEYILYIYITCKEAEWIFLNYKYRSILIWGIGPSKIIYQWFKVEKKRRNVYFHVLSSASLWSCRQNRLFSPAPWGPPLIGWLHFEWHATRPITGLIQAHWLSLAVNTAKSPVMFEAIEDQTHFHSRLQKHVSEHAEVTPSSCLFKF